MGTNTRTSERGIALVAVLLMMALVAAVAAGFAAISVSEHRLQAIEQGRQASFYAAHGGLEKLTSDLATLFARQYKPTPSQVSALADDLPELPGVTFPSTSEGPGYGITFVPDASGGPTATPRSITSGVYQGFTGLVTPYTLSVTARLADGSETRLQRQLHTVGIPIFQFGIFSESDVAFEPGPEFTFSGRVHTNGNLFLLAGSGRLTLTEKVTAVGEVVRRRKPNGELNDWSDDTMVYVVRSPGNTRALRRAEASVTDGPTSSLNEPTWTNISTGTYNGNIRNGRTGARRLDLPINTAPAGSIELIRRPLASEDPTSLVYSERFFSKATVRILLSDTAQDILGLPGVSPTAPVELGAAAPGGYTVDATHPPFAVAKTGTGVVVPQDTPLLGGFLKIEKRISETAWQDVTLDILRLGIAGVNIQRLTCGQPNPDAVLRIQRVTDSATTCANGSVSGRDYLPQTLFDPRQGKLQDTEPTATTTVQIGGVIHYIELDVRNLSRWLSGTIGTQGSGAWQTDGYVVYFSDRRDNRDTAGNETGEYGFEDVVNPNDAAGMPNNTLDAAEDFNGNGTLERYGATYAGRPLGFTAPLGAGVTPWTHVSVDVAKRNPARFFRRALKLTNGAAGNIIAPGLTVVAENPVYVQGNYNAGPSFDVAHVACAIIADAVTLLSNNWIDQRVWASPYETNNRPATTTWYRMAIMGGKGFAFNRNWGLAGSDGGVNNFIRFLEDWENVTAHWRGAMVSLWRHRQAVYPFRAAWSNGVGNNTYFPPDRDFLFDTEFLQFSLLPPQTPMFRDVNVLGFTQVTAGPQ